MLGFANSKTILYIIIAGLVVYGMIYFLTPKSVIPTEYKAKIDSLTAANKILEAKQKQADSTIAVYNDKVAKVDERIDNIKKETTIIREYYHETITVVKNYTATEVDSFLKTRYKY